MYKLADYPFEVHPLSAADGGGYLISYPDFAECIGDGDTIEAAITNGREALIATIATLQDKGFAIPMPNSGGIASGKFTTHLPKTLHAQLTVRAKTEGISLNALVLAFIAEGLGKRS